MCRKLVCVSNLTLALPFKKKINYVEIMIYANEEISKLSVPVYGKSTCAGFV